MTLQPFLDQILVFVLVLSRIGGLILSSPIFGSRNVPLRIRGLIAVSLSLLVTPVFWGTVLDDPGNLLFLLVLVGREAALGLVLGLGISILFMSLQVAGQILSQMSALSLADVFDPTFNGTVSVFSQLFEVIALTCFLMIGGHRQVMGALMETFHWMPPGEVMFSAGVVEALVEITTRRVIWGVRAAAPTMTALLISILVLGLISRTLPQLNILAVGLGINTFVLIGTVALSLGSVVLIFKNEIEPTIALVLSAFRPS